MTSVNRISRQGDGEVSEGTPRAILDILSILCIATLYADE